MSNHREILFRGFHPCEDGGTTIYVEGETVKGRWVEGLPGYGINGRVSEIQHFDSPAICNLFDILPSTVCQYTGLADKNGVKIFEGDVCIYPSCGGIDYEFNKGAVKFGEYQQDGSGGEYPPKKVTGFYIERQSVHLGKLAYDGYQPFEPDYMETDTILQDYIEVIGTIWDKEATT